MLQRVSGLVLLAVFSGSSLCAEEFTADEAGALVERLGHKEFKERQAASAQLKALIKMNPDLVKLFAPYLDHQDPEIRVRLREGLEAQRFKVGWLAPDQEGKIRSPQDKHPRHVRMRNASNLSVRIFWLDYEGKRVPWSVSSVGPGQSRTCHASYSGHAWLFTDPDGKALGIFILGKDTTEIVFTGAVE